MIRFTLQCPEGHRFESWFRDGAAFDVLSKAGDLVCPDCGSTEVAKSLMTPRVRPARSAAAPGSDEAAADTPLSAADDRERALEAFRRKVEAEADYVGPGFVREARAMHLGDAPERPIYGEAKPADAIALIEDGIPVAPLPFVPGRKAN